MFVLPLEVAVSYRLARRYSQSLEATYIAVFAGGDQESDASIRGAATLTNLTLSTFSEWRLSRVVALTLLARVMVYRGNARVKTHFSQGSTTVDADLGASKPYQGLVACAVPALSLSFAHFDFQLGLGYGNWWLPVVQLALPEWGLVPEADFSVRFKKMGEPLCGYRINWKVGEDKLLLVSVGTSTTSPNRFPSTVRIGVANNFTADAEVNMPSASVMHR